MDLSEDIEFEDGEYIFSNAITKEEVYPHADIKVERDQFPIFQLKRMLKNNRIELAPSFQREGDMWNSEAKSELIESVLMGIPLPLFYFNQDENGILVIVDGRQRLSTFFDFMNNQFKLTGLKLLEKYNGKNFSDLEIIEQGMIEDFQLICQVIKPPTPDRIKFDIFDRVNRGGVRLNNQEMRNALYQGNATKLLNDLSKMKIFKKATNNSISEKRMKDKYLILRAITFSLVFDEDLKKLSNQKFEIQRDMDEVYGNTMKFLNKTNKDSLEKISTKLLKSLKNSTIIFGNEAFRRVEKGPINMILFDAFTVLMMKFDTSYCESNRKIIKSICDQKVRDEEFNNLLVTDRGRNIFIQKLIEDILKLEEEIKKNVEEHRN